MVSPALLTQNASTSAMTARNSEEIRVVATTTAPQQYSAIMEDVIKLNANSALNVSL
jgi:hypothetical protein